jgi:hypothetical protein
MKLRELLSKPLGEGGPYDLPGKDYHRPGDTPRKRSSGEHNPYPFSKEEDDDYFRDIFRKKREAAKKAEQDKQKGVAETASLGAISASVSPAVPNPTIARSKKKVKSVSALDQNSTSLFGGPMENIQAPIIKRR